MEQFKNWINQLTAFHTNVWATHAVYIGLGFLVLFLLVGATEFVRYVTGSEAVINVLIIVALGLFMSFISRKIYTYWND